MTALNDILIQQITRTGPISLAEYMATCLMHPEHGYYSTRDPLGAAGDFTTAPEISQMFGELIGLCLAQSWLELGAPTPFALVELGPGRGTLMADILRATKGVSGFHQAAQVHLVEASPTLRKMQAEQVPQATWHDTIATLPDLPLFLVANEFFDALPIRQFQRDPSGWREVMVQAQDNRLVPGLSEPAPIAALDHRLEDTKPGDVVETCAPARAIMQDIGQQIASRGGVALVIDYGDWRSQGDTFQALKNHQATDPMAEPGSADLTAHVDFEALAHAAHPARFTRIAPQGVFLERLGITARAQALAANLSGDTLETHVLAHRRLTHPDEMGSLFKVVAIYQEGSVVPAGLEP
ncbi:MAG: SAM-dependent methyltransferase [Pelagimonas sp.]|jgi:SAM-dependent MidA family methyltransferase|nr:SAM-dependent methyltransferase [Pelagimonas sp.]